MAEEITVGVFDSGIGGLTVLRQLIEQIPGVSFTYLGDTARVPYGSKGADTVTRYALRCTSLLAAEGVSVIVIACNTASAYAIDALRDAYDIPIVGVVGPGARAAAAQSASGRIGVLATSGTVASGAYQDVLHSLRPDAEVFAHSCPLFVPLAEEGWTEGEVPEKVCKIYLDPVLANSVDTILLGCTHFPLFADLIQRTAGEGVRVIDSAHATADAVQELVTAIKPDTTSNGVAHRFLVTDDPAKFRDVGARFLGDHIDSVEWVDLG